MDFTLSDKQVHWRDRVVAFMNQHVYPAVPVYMQQMKDFGENRWQVVPIVEELKAKAKAEGLWNLFLPRDSVPEGSPYRGAGLTNLEYALCAEEMGKVGLASEVFNCSAPDTGNMEVLHRYGTREQKERWLQPLMDGEIRSAFLMTEPGGRLVRRDQHRDRDRARRRPLRHQRPQMVVVGRRRSALQGRDRDGQDRPRGAAPLAAVADPGAAGHARRRDRAHAAGVRLRRRAARPRRSGVRDVRVPVANLLLGEGRGFEIAQGRLGPGPHPPLHAHHRRRRSRRSRRWPSACSRASRSASASPTSRCGNSASPKRASTSR